MLGCRKKEHLPQLSSLKSTLLFYLLGHFNSLQLEQCQLLVDKALSATLASRLPCAQLAANDTTPQLN